MEKKKLDNKKTEDNKEHKKKDSEIFVNEFGKYLDDLTDEEIVPYLEDLR